MTNSFIGTTGADLATVRPQANDAQLVAVFDTNNGAHLARDALVAAGLPRTSVHVIDRVEPQSAGGKSSAHDRRTALLAAIGSLFSRSESPAQFHLAEDPRHALVVVDRGQGVDHARADQILHASGPVEVYRSA